MLQLLIEAHSTLSRTLDRSEFAFDTPVESRYSPASRELGHSRRPAEMTQRISKLRIHREFLTGRPDIHTMPAARLSHRESPATPGKDLRSVGNGNRILVVDGLEETEQVLKAVLEPRGMEIQCVQGFGPREEQAVRTPDVVILHDDGRRKSRVSLKKWQGIPHVIIGSLEVLGGSHQTADEQYLLHPFHYGDLIQAIERLLAE